ncbi:DUF3570 domain-containing protein [Paraflavitalea pollutisoli]|uniref:DUF3570 domain-containing protein n=1 Tax=Paraflavitalea pollutisoli TaxID=3034143 RepID=UPI0023EABFAF|nr:DUF3570 domain-containing protein [Paraflavitalea sp. H1-2-19X]
MKQVFLTALGLLALLRSYSQQTPDTTGFHTRKLKVEEVNLVSSYYVQQGDHAAVTGGIGDQHLTDIANVFDVKLSKYDKRWRKHTFDFELGIDHYTSASSDKIDLKANSSASHADTRIYPSLTWTVENEKKGRSFGVGISSSTEFDYQSFGVNLSFSQKTRDRSGEFSARLQGYFDQVKLVTPEELRTGSGLGDDGYGTDNRTTLAASLSWTQVINKNLQVALLADVVQQQGFLSLPFYRVYFKDGSVHQEKLPDSRFKLPVGVRANYFLGDRIIIRTYYRYYQDDWGIRSHTANIEVPVKITPFFSVSPFYRFYHQTAVNYFAPYQTHTAAEQFYTSNYDLSDFNSHFLGAGLRLSPPKPILGIKHFNMLELRYGHYTKNIQMNANIVSLNLRFK